jgi:hypothetical protein
MLVRMQTKRRSFSKPASNRESATVADKSNDDRPALRSYALDALSEAVLITDAVGRITDCNSSALALFDRHRGAIEEQFARSMRRFDGVAQDYPIQMASERGVWVGEAWTRQPDGGVRLCVARVIAVRDRQARVNGFVESYRDTTADKPADEEFRNLLYGVRAFDSSSANADDATQAVNEDLRLLSEAFRDLDVVLRHYDRLLKMIGPDDPLAEVVAGVVHDTRAAVASVGLSSLLEDIPRALTRLRAHVQQLEENQRREGSVSREPPPAQPLSLVRGTGT